MHSVSVPLDRDRAQTLAFCGRGALHESEESGVGVMPGVHLM